MATREATRPRRTLSLSRESVQQIDPALPSTALAASRSNNRVVGV